MDPQTILAILVGVALACFSLVMVGYSFLRNRNPQQETAPARPGPEEDGVGLDSLLDSVDTLELEYQLGNIPEEQYAQQLVAYREQIALVIKVQLESENPPPELLLEQEVLRARENGEVPWQSCPQCDAPLPVSRTDGSDSLTCPHCGAGVRPPDFDEGDPEALTATPVQSGRAIMPLPSPHRGFDGWSAIRILLLAGLILGAMAALILAAPAPAPAQETLTIRGKVVNGTAGGQVPQDLVVLMLVTGPDGTLSGTGQAVAEPDGSFVFEDVAPVTDGSYNVSVDYEGVFYGQSLLAEELADEAVVTIYEPTEDAGIIRVERQVMVISGFDEAERVATATEFVRFTNPTDMTLRPNLETARPGMFSFMRFALPPGAADITVQSNLRGGEIISVGSGFALTAAVPPGQHSVDFAYTFPYQGGALDFRNSLPQGADIFQVLVPNRWDGIDIGGLTPRPAVGIGDEIYRAWEGRDIPAGPGVQLEFSGLPEPGILARMGNTLSGGSFWVTAIPSAMGAILLALLLLGLFRRYGPVADAEASAANGAAALSDSRQRAEIVASLATLDDRYQDGGIGQDDYLRQRSALVSRALGNDAGPED